jgi:GTP-binding protein EngB required for normal cell division
LGDSAEANPTLMNAILGGDHLPTGIVPLTSVITTVRYGSRKQVVLNFNDHSLRHEVPLSQLPDYVTQQSNPGNVKNIAYAEIELPVEILRRGFFFVDSPGLGSSIAENTQTTENFLPQADAFILVTSYESPLSEEEDRILQRIRFTNKKLFVVVNKQDTVSKEEQKEALAFIAERLGRLALSEAPRIFSVSARQGLQAKQSGDCDLLDKSGLESFEAELLRFLTEERAQSLLSNMYERTTAFLAQRLRGAGHAMDTEASNRLAEGLSALREKSLGAGAQSGVAVAAGEDNSSVAKLQLEKRAGCWICAAVLDAIFAFLSQYQYELTINPNVQKQHADRGGFCPLHTWQYENIASPYGVGTAYPRLAHRIARELERLSEEASDASGYLENLRGLPATAQTCRVCEIRIEAEKMAVASATGTARDAAISGDMRLRAYCLPHLALVAGSLGPGEAARNLLRSHARLLERTAEDLQRYALRHNALRRYLASEEERRASQLVLLLLAGHRSVSAPWTVESIL